MQFYPPGFFYLGALVVRGSFGLVDVAATYQTLLWLTWLAPAVTTFLALARPLGNGWLALPRALIALALSAGVTRGVQGRGPIRVLPAPHGLALHPVGLARSVTRGTDPRTPWLTAPHRQ